jgi:hypothetical protein
MPSIRESPASRIGTSGRNNVIGPAIAMSGLRGLPRRNSLWRRNLRAFRGSKPLPKLPFHPRGLPLCRAPGEIDGLSRKRGPVYVNGHAAPRACGVVAVTRCPQRVTAISPRRVALSVRSRDVRGPIVSKAGCARTPDESVSNSRALSLTSPVSLQARSVRHPECDDSNFPAARRPKANGGGRGS